VRKRHWIGAAFPYTLVVAGALIVFGGARDLVESRLGQYEAEREFSGSVRSQVVQPTIYRPQAGDIIAKMIIPRLNAELYVVEGTDAADLRRGPGHLTGTAMPGEAGNCVIAGHRDTHFRILREIRPGDTVIFERDASRFVYRVKRLQIVSPANVAALQPSAHALHLITCYPLSYFGAAPKRMVVEAQLTGS
jgi:sortase A